jgi:hypothetical protein
MARTKKTSIVENNEWPKINQGSHLTVKTFEDGRTELVWDDEALLQDVQLAILSIESRNPVIETKRKSKEKENGDSKISKQTKRQVNKSK